MSESDVQNKKIQQLEFEINKLKVALTRTLQLISREQLSIFQADIIIKTLE